MFGLIVYVKELLLIFHVVDCYTENENVKI
jgi:hypothetical protein